VHLIPHRILQNTERTYHCIIMHFFKKEKRKQSIIKLNKQSINVTLIDFRNTNMFRSCIMKWKWTNSNVATSFRRSPVFDGLFHVIKSLIILIASFVRGYIMMLKCMNELKKSDLKMSSLNVRTTYHIYYFTFKLYFFVIHFFVTLTKL
jgi:hypothetical protein